MMIQPKCCICLTNEGKIEKLTCCTSAHVHVKCIKESIVTNNSKCPLCRTEIEYRVQEVNTGIFYEKLIIVLKIIMMVALVTSTVVLGYLIVTSDNHLGINRGTVWFRGIVFFLPFAHHGDQWYTARNVTVLWILCSDMLFYILYATDNLLNNSQWTYLVIYGSVIGITIVSYLIYNIERVCTRMMCCGIGIKTCFVEICRECCHSCINFFTKCNEHETVRTDEIVFENSI
jgi:hypothetical protein